MKEEVEKILLEMEESVIALVSNSKELCTLSKSTNDPKGFEALQEKQESLVNIIVSLDQKLTNESTGDKSFQENKVWKEIEKQLEQFQKNNNDFIESLKVRQGLIEFELKDIKKSRQMLLDMQNSYAIPKKAGNQSTPGKRINTTF